MSWLIGLYETFENNQALLQAQEDPLIPICHTTQQAHIEVVLSGDGEFLRADVVPRDDNTTLIPCTESSSSRAGTKPQNHPLCDKLQYVAGDFVKYGGVVTSGFAKEPTVPYESYVQDLRQWADSIYSHPKLNAILRYVEQSTLIEDLVKYCILPVDTSGKLLQRWTSQDEAPKIFTVLPSNQAPHDAFIRWVVETPGIREASVWNDQELVQVWIDYYISNISERDICYVTGKQVPIALFHPAKIRNDGDKAKLISGNDDSGFTFRGRFESDSQAVSVGFEVTQKAHNMLRWLVRNQGFRSGDLAIVAWASVGKLVPNPVSDSTSLLASLDLPLDEPQQEPEVAYTAEEFALKLRKKILGLKQELGEFTNVNVIALDSATPGRMSISFYRELWSSEFLNRLENWHMNYAWEQNYRPRGVDKDFPYVYIGTPSLFDIAEAAYGTRIDAELRAKTIQRLLPSVIEGQPLPSDLLGATVRRATNRVAFSEEWEWRKTLTIACGLYKGANIKEGYAMALDRKRDTRDYLYGRLLAYADNLESWALSEADTKRATNAARSMNRFAQRPFSTWLNLEIQLEPYKNRLNPKITNWLGQTITEVMDLFDPDDYTNDRPLSGEFLLGYHCQMSEFRKGSPKKAEETDVKPDLDQ
jgi:CRISPR-associated protein Csd1